ncbi:Putative extracellular membrane protein, CFEM [Septoria linicola]|uniref:Extracellular membrane protein, CFEM n=1 Tax=Septoria linicola TaxID=215465 RepID=A0A9Q9EKS1_9PEZI|nr:Putative extracellular membrane protein, CFEM [Septoria linicola]
MHLISAVLITASFSLQHAAATGGSYGGAGWGGHNYYSTPDTTDNKCSTNQTKGYDWSDLADGSFDSYGSNKFSGWSCSNSFGKRDLLSKRTFQSKCITSNLDDEPAVDCDGDDKMSIKTYHVSSDQDEDVDIECHYTMPDESICKEVHSCASSGSIIKNTQCGGAKKVTFKPHGKSKGKGCNIGVHSIEFDCETASIPPSYSTTFASVTSTSQPPTYSTSSSISSAETTSASSSGTTSSEAPPQYSSATESVPQYSSSSSEVIPSYSSPSSVETSPVTPSAPVYSAPPGYGNSSTVQVPGYGSSSTVTSKVPEETPSYPPPETPDVLPKCVNSWLHLTECKSNTDYECFCKNSELVSKVYDCVSAWSDSDDDTNSGAGYFMGLCAKYVPENPAIITGCPSTITPATKYNTPASTPNSPVTEQPPASTGTKVTRYSTIISTITSCGSDVKDCPAASTYLQSSTQAVATTFDAFGTSPSPNVPCTTITYSSEITLPATYSTGESQGATVPSSSYTTSYVTTVTVPLVQITTYTVTESGSTRNVPGLGYETPAPAPSSSAPAPAPYPTSSVPGPVGPVGTSSLGTTYVPKPTNTVTPYTGAGHRFDLVSGLGVACAAFAGAMLL